MNKFFIVAVDSNWGISKDSKLPWFYPDDFKFFKKRTMYTTCIMGFNTYKEIAELRDFPNINNELLSNRNSIVITSKDLNHIGDIKSSTNPDIHHKLSSPVAFIGGVAIYDYAMSDPYVEGGYITRIKKDFGCDRFFNKDLLLDNFIVSRIIKETDDLIFEQWERK